MHRDPILLQKSNKPQIEKDSAKKSLNTEEILLVETDHKPLQATFKKSLLNAVATTDANEGAKIRI